MSNVNTVSGRGRSGAGSTRAAAEHDTAGENSGLATIVRGNILLAVVHVDTRLAGTLPAGHGLRATAGRAGNVARRGRNCRRSGEARARVGGARAAAGVRRSRIHRAGGWGTAYMRLNIPVAYDAELMTLNCATSLRT